MNDQNITEGQCLCGAVKFSIKGTNLGLYQCHCSECRKITGSNANSSVIVPETLFSWVEGEEKITSYTHSSGYRSDFCSSCGSPAPNKIKNKPLFWVPAGALSQSALLEVKAHICISSKAAWETSDLTGTQYNEVPSFEKLLEVIGTYN